MRNFKSEYEGQMDFYDRILVRVDRSLTIDDILSDNTDGILNGSIIEFKLNINDINKVLFQSVKYLSSMRIKGKDLPQYIVLVDLNAEKVFIFNAEDFIDQIEVVYYGAASCNNEGFIIAPGIDPLEIDYSKSLGASDLIKHLRKHGTTKYHVDENCIVGLAERFYSEVPGSSKIDLLGDVLSSITGEIRNPAYFSDTIYPYKEATNEKMAYIMDKLNPNFMQKDLGAFYTPVEYAKKSHDLVYDAIRRHQVSGNADYVIIDTCAGTGNLEEFINEEVPFDILDKDVLSHCILNTYEYMEYKILVEKLGDKVREIIPPVERKDTFVNGLVRGSDALSEEFLKNPVIQQYIENPDVTVIVYENPPYAETTSIEHQKNGKSKDSSLWKKQKAVSDAKEDLKGAASNDMANVFIHKALKNYLRKEEDSLIVFSPVKYWKNNDWFNKKFNKGFVFNRRHFHTTSDTVVTCILWDNKDVSGQDEIKLDAYDIKHNALVKVKEELVIKRIHSFFSSEYYDRRTFADDVKVDKNDYQKNGTNAGIWCLKNGSEYDGQQKLRINTLYNENIIGYMVAQANTFELPACMTHLFVAASYGGNGFHLRSDNFIEKLPMFAAGWWSTYNKDWTLNGVIYRSGDGKKRFEYDLKNQDPVLLKWLDKVLFYTCFEYYNKIRSLYGSDGRTYVNELCLHNNTDHAGYKTSSMRKLKKETLAYATLREHGFFDNMTDEEKTMFTLYNKILSQAKNTKNYVSQFNYGPFQIERELNTHRIEFYENGKSYKAYDYPELNGSLNSLRKLIKNYYRNEIQDNLFRYEFLK